MQRVIKRERIQVGELTSKTNAKTPSPGSRTTARSVRLVKLDGRIAAIEFTCSCGEVSVLELCYDEAQAPQP